MSTQQKVGIALLVAPIPTLMVVLASYAIVNFVVQSIVMSGGGGGSVVVASVINIFLGFLGILALLGIIIGMPVGAILLATGGKKDPKTQSLDKKEKS